MKNENIMTLSIYLREILEDIIEDLYSDDDELSKLENEEKIEYIIKFLVSKHPDEQKYFKNYKEVISGKTSSYKKFMIGFLITDFYEIQTVIRDRGRQSEEFNKYYNFITTNFNTPQVIINYFLSCKNMDFNRSIVENYIVFQNENKAFFFKAVKKQMENKNVCNLNKINPFYICETGIFLDNNKLNEFEDIIDEVIQCYYDEFSAYMLKEESDEHDIEVDIDFYDENEEEPEYTVNEDDEIIFDESEEECIFNLPSEDEIEEQEEETIYRLLKLRIIQKFISKDNTKLFDAISYIIANVYENMIYDASHFSNEILLRNEIYIIINDSNQQELIELFINDDDFSTLVLKYFIEYNEYQDMDRSKEKREYIELNGYKEKVKKLNKFYNEENNNLKDY